MNFENIKLLRSHLHTLSHIPFHAIENEKCFNMYGETREGYPTGIAAHAVVVMYKHEPGRLAEILAESGLPPHTLNEVLLMADEDIRNIAQKWLELPDDVADDLFEGTWAAPVTQPEDIYEFEAAGRLSWLLSMGFDVKTENKNTFNVEAILAVANLIENTKNYENTKVRETRDRVKLFDMCVYHSCGSPRCIAGWAAHYGKMQMDEYSVRGVHEKGAEVLGLDYECANHVFLGSWSHKPMDEITVDEAVSYLRSLVS